MSNAVSIQLKAHFSPNERQNMVQSDTEPTASVRPRHAGNMLLYSQFPQSPKETVRVKLAAWIRRESTDWLADAEAQWERSCEGWTEVESTKHNSTTEGCLKLSDIVPVIQS